MHIGVGVAVLRPQGRHPPRSEIRSEMRKTLLAASWGILLLFSPHCASADYFFGPVLKLCEVVNTAGTSTADGPIDPENEPGTEKAQAKPNLLSTTG